MNKPKKNIEIELDYSEYYDFELVVNYEQNHNILIDVVLDSSDLYDFELTDDEINKNELIYMLPKCLNCSDAFLSLDSQYGFLLTDNYEYLELSGTGGRLMYH